MKQHHTDSHTLEKKAKKKSSRFRQALVRTVIMLVAAAVAAVLAAGLWMPVFEIYGRSMSPTLQEGAVVIGMRDRSPAQGEVVAFYVENKILIKRVIAVGGDKLDIAQDGTIYVNDQALEEPYISRKHEDVSNILLPYEVPAGEWFVMGDNRGSSVDSRHTTVGTVKEEQLAGKLVFQIWPMSGFGFVK